MDNKKTQSDSNTENKIEKKLNQFFVVFIGVVIFILLVLNVFGQIKEITPSSLVLICLLIFLAVIKYFDNISIGAGLLSVSRNISNANENDVKEKDDSDTEEINAVTGNKLTRQEIVEFALGKIEPTGDNITKNVIITQSQSNDLISEKDYIFDAYIKNANNEKFIVIKPAIKSIYNFVDKLYVMLNRIFLSNKICKSKAHLILVFVSNSNEEAQTVTENIENLNNIFKPAKESGLLRIEHFTYKDK